MDDIFTPSIDSETGDIRRWPWGGNLMEQPYPGFNILRVIQGEYLKAKREAKQKTA